MPLVFKSLGRGVYTARNGTITYRVECVGKRKAGAHIYDATASSPRRVIVRHIGVPSLDAAKGLLRDFDSRLPALPAREARP